MIPLIVNSEISLQSDIKSITVIVYQQYYLPLVEELIDHSVLFEEELALFEDSNNPNEFYITFRVTEENSFGQRKSIEEVIGLGNHIIGIELDNEKQSFIENNYLSLINRSEHNYSLKFVNSSYTKIHERMNENIYYYKSIRDLMMRTSSSKILPEEALIKKLFSSIERVSRMKVKDIVYIYQECSLMNKPTREVKGIFEGFKGHEERKKYIEIGEKMIFEEGINDKKAQSEIMKMPISKEDKAKLFWKIDELRKYRQLKLSEENHRNQIQSFKEKSIYHIDNGIISMWIIEYSQRWTKNTLKDLKKSFDTIANRRDTKALTEFRKKYQQSINKIKEVKAREKLNKEKQLCLQKMEKQVKDFMKYHEEIIEGQFLSTIQYYKNEIKYKWNYEPKIYQKGATLFLIVFLAYLQEDFILGITILSIGLIFSAVNI